MVAGRNGNHNIAYFTDGIKPLVLNSTNSKTLKSFCKNSSFVEDWSNVLIELYIDANVKMKGDIVGGVRIKPNQPSLKKPYLTPDNKNWAKAKEAVQTGTATLETIRKNWTITDENYQNLCL